MLEDDLKFVVICINIYYKYLKKMNMIKQYKLKIKKNIKKILYIYINY